MDEREHRLPRLHTGPMRVVGRQSEGGGRKAWDARQWLKEHASRDFRRTPGKGNDGNKGSGMTTVTVQAAICGLVLIAVLLLKALNIPQTQEVLAGLNQALTTETDIDRALGKLKFVGDFFGNSEPVFNPKTEGFVPPIADMSVETGGTPQYVVSVDVGSASAPVLAAADGQVFYAGTSSDYGTLIIIRHQEGYETWYGGLTPEVRAGHTVLAGERIGAVQNARFKFLAFQDGEPLDPRPYMKKADD